jgi:ABC-type polar amino acid transport system ATPase subunit
MASVDQPAPATAAASGQSPTAADTSLMIDVRKLNKFFGERHVLVDVDFPVKRGECVAIIGPSGSGKSTLIRCINYLETPTSGTIRIDGKAVTADLSAAELSQVRRELGMVFYNFNLFPHKCVLDNITLAPISVR